MYKDKTEVFKSLLGIEAYKLPYSDFKTIETKYLPEYVLINNKEFYITQNVIDEITESDELIFINYHVFDYSLENEISNVGFDSFWFDVGMPLKFNNIDNLKHKIYPYVNHIIIESRYDKYFDYYNGGYEYDSDIKIVGILDKDFKLIKF